MGDARGPTTPVETRDLEQWFCRITDYAQELLDDLDDLDWPERVKLMQRNWIGRSEGAEFGLPIADDTGNARTDVEPLAVYTTRPDTGFGMTFAVLSPEHPRVDELTTDAQRAAVDAFRTRGRWPVRDRPAVDRRIHGQARRGHGRIGRQPVHRATDPPSTWPTTC